MRKRESRFVADDVLKLLSVVDAAYRHCDSAKPVLNVSLVVGQRYNLYDMVAGRQPVKLTLDVELNCGIVRPSLRNRKYAHAAAPTTAASCKTERSTSQNSFVR